MSATVETHALDAGLFTSLLTDDAFWPTEPATLRESGLNEAFVEGLSLKTLFTIGTCSGRGLAEQIGLPFAIIDPLLDALRTRRLVTHVRPAPFNDYYYSVSDYGQERAQSLLQQSSYIGPAPVTLADYSLSVEAQVAGLEVIGRTQLAAALNNVTHDDELLEQLGPAVNCNAGLLLYGSPGNGKTTIARHLMRCLGQEVWVPHAIWDDGNLIKVFDESYHRPAPMPQVEGMRGVVKLRDWDRRWHRIQRPMVIVGGELTLDNLEIRHDRRSNTCEAPLQLKSNCGCLLIDDFGRQRVQPAELLNRWIIPLENQVDYLTLPTGKKIQTPFLQMIIFSTNLNPHQLVDEAFLRRVPFKVLVRDPDASEYRQIFRKAAEQMEIQVDDAVLDHVISLYTRTGRPMRRCHPRDLLMQVRAATRYQHSAPQVNAALLERAWQSYFSNL
jgi:predicted ATPase with chaperone activity